ncbi:MAG: hypothetical protein JXB29_00220 [Sedimentisphaerales bacterium]|nr:hypothetical protein [Sedimentisphaerales bacterium]
MNTFWLKIAVAVVVIIGLLVLVSRFLPGESQPKEQPKTFYDVTREDDKRLRADIEPEEQPIEQEQKAQQPEPQETAKVVKPKYEKLNPENEVRASQLFEMALAQRKMGRLPGIGYKQMVDYCREIIEKYPKSSYAPKARRMLGEVPQRYWKLYKITTEEVNPSK